MKKRLLIAEDDPDIRMCVKDFTESELGSDVEIVEACDGREAIEAIRDSQRKRFDGVLTDFNMPFCDGIEVANAAFGTYVPNVILMSAQQRAHLIQVYGIDVFDKLIAKGLKIIPKPFDLDTIAEKVLSPLRKVS